MNILEIMQDGRHISLYRGFLRISQKEDIVADIPLDSIMAVLITGRQISYSNNILAELAERNIPLIVCGENYHPVGILSATVGNCRQTHIAEMQIQASLPLKKNLWKSIVVEKIRNQDAVLKCCGAAKVNLEAYYKNVKSGDTDNFEGIAARMYFPALFGDNFLRNYTGNGINAFLNYGYAVMRAALARYVVAAGLLPSFGIHHKNKLNAFCLVDDLIEPYRPVVDKEVYEIFKDDLNAEKELKPEYKRILSGLLEKEITTKEGKSPLRICMQNTVWSLVKSYENKEDCLIYERKLI